jgi:Protein of unknown function (DUF3987)
MLDANFPRELQNVPHWILWKHEDVGGRKTKVPYSVSGYKADTTNAKTWTTFNKTQESLNGFDDFSGLGFVFTPPYVGVDLDKCRDPQTGIVQPWALEAIKMLDSYTELSPSKTGFHILLKGALPEGGNRKGPVEVYTKGRYFTITGDHVEGTPTTINQRDLTQFHSKFILSGNDSKAPKDESVSAIEWKLACDIAKKLGATASHEDVKLEFLKQGNYRDKWKNNKSYLDRTIKNAIEKVHGSAATAVLSEDVEDEPEIEIAEEPLPEFPMIPGSIGELAEAICLDIPRAYKVVAAITRVGLLLSGRVSLESEKHLQPRFYSVLIGNPWFGKSAALNETGRFLPNGFKVVRSVDSGPALVNLFNNLRKDSTLGAPLRVLLFPDEIRDVFEKAKIVSNSKNSLLKEYITLYQENYTESRTVGRGDQEITTAHLAILGSVQPDVYESMWTNTGGGSSGLQSRFILAAFDKPMPERQAKWDEAEAQAAANLIYQQIENAPATIRITEEAYAVFRDWWKSVDQTKPSIARIADIVKQVLIVLAVTNNTAVIEPWLMQVGVEFGKYQIAMRERFNPSDAYTWVQEACSKIEALLKKRGPMTLRDLRRFTNAKRLKGGYDTFDKAMTSLKRVEVICAIGKTRKGKERWALNE